MAESVRSEPVSRPTTPRVDVAAILAGAKANRDRCREAKAAAQVYRWQPRRAWTEPEPEPEPSQVSSGEDSDDELTVSRAQAEPRPRPRAKPLVISSEEESDEELRHDREWTEAKSSELAAFDPLAIIAKSASPPSMDRPRDGSPAGRGRRVEHTPTRQLNPVPRCKQRSRGRRRIEQARAYAENGELDSDGSPQRAEGKMVSLPPASDEGLFDSEYTEEDLDEIASTQAHLLRGFEDLMAECDLMLQAESGATELESLQGAVSAVAHRLETLDRLPRDVDEGMIPADSGSSSRNRGRGVGSGRTSRSKARDMDASGSGPVASRRLELEADVEREIDMELATGEVKAAGLHRRQLIVGKRERHSRAQRCSDRGPSRNTLESDSTAGSELGGSARRTVSTKGADGGTKSVFSTSAAAAAGTTRASSRKPPRR